MKITRFRVKMAFSTFAFNRFGIKDFFSWFNSGYDFTDYEKQYKSK